MLGGHQNAHKREGSIAKGEQKVIASTTMSLANPFLHNHNKYTNTSMASFSLHDAYNNKSLGIQAHSLI